MSGLSNLATDYEDHPRRIVRAGWEGLQGVKEGDDHDEQGEER
jgi:hypothetical protein